MVIYVCEQCRSYSPKLGQVHAAKRAEGRSPVARRRRSLLRTRVLLVVRRYVGDRSRADVGRTVVVHLHKKPIGFLVSFILYSNHRVRIAYID